MLCLVVGRDAVGDVPETDSSRIVDKVQELDFPEIRTTTVEVYEVVPPG
jgi:hypothetical protein